MDNNRSDQFYLENVQSVIKTVLIHSDRRSKPENLSGEIWEVEKCFKMMLSMANFINYKLTKIEHEDSAFDETFVSSENISTLEVSQTSKVSELVVPLESEVSELVVPQESEVSELVVPQESAVSELDVYQASKVLKLDVSQSSKLSDLECDYSLNELDIKLEAIDEITKTSIDDIFNNLQVNFDATIFDQVEEQEELKATFIINKDDDEKLLLEDPMEEAAEETPEDNISKDFLNYEKVSVKHPKLTTSPIRKFRLKSTVEKSKIRHIKCEGCSFETNNIRCLHKHIREEHRELEYFCPFCEFNTDQKRRLKSHVNRQHPTKNCKFVS